MDSRRTGRTRYRAHHTLFGKILVVLQVEWEISGKLLWSNDGGRVDCETIPTYKEWRDATIEDITVSLVSEGGFTVQQAYEDYKTKELQ